MLSDPSLEIELSRGLPVFSRPEVGADARARAEPTGEQRRATRRADGEADVKIGEPDAGRGEGVHVRGLGLDVLPGADRERRHLLHGHGVGVGAEVAPAVVCGGSSDKTASGGEEAAAM